MKTGRGKEFSDTAMGYIYDVAAKRRLNPMFLEGEGWEEYQRRTSISSRAMEFGKDCEMLARDEYQDRNKVVVTECGFMLHPTVDWLGDSPDGLIMRGNAIEGAIEIKCPDSKTYIKYEHELKSGKSLKEINPDYYWQCLCHMEVNATQWVDFVVYDIMLNRGYFQTRIELNEEVSKDTDLMIERVIKANAIINEINK